jgi:predicted Zn-dependent protease
MRHRAAFPVSALCAAVLALLFFVPALLAQEPDPPAAAPEASPVLPPEALAAVDSAMAGGRHVEASELLDRLEAQHPAARQPELDLLRAEWLIAVGRAAEALPRLAAIMADEPLRCRIVTAKTMALLASGAFGDADRLNSPEEARCGGEPVYLRGLARLHLARGRPGDAAAALRRAVALEPASVDTQGELAVALVEAGEADAAVMLLTALVRRDPSRPDLRLNLDFARGMLGERPVRVALDDDMFWSRRLQFAGLGARQAGRARLAEAILGQALLARPRHDAELWRQYAEISGSDTKGQTLARH